jgi:hypothetical protein
VRAVACIVFVGAEAVRAGQSLLGDADPLKASPGSLRAELCLDARYARMCTHTRKRARMRNEVRTFCQNSPSSVAPYSLCCRLAPRQFAAVKSHRAGRPFVSARHTEVAALHSMYNMALHSTRCGFTSGHLYTHADAAHDTEARARCSVCVQLQWLACERIRRGCRAGHRTVV